MIGKMLERLDALSAKYLYELKADYDKSADTFSEMFAYKRYVERVTGYEVVFIKGIAELRERCQ